MQTQVESISRVYHNVQNITKKQKERLALEYHSTTCFVAHTICKRVGVVTEK